MSQDHDSNDETIALPKNHGPIPDFRVLVRFYQQLSNVSGIGVTEKRRGIVDTFINTWREQVGNDIYPAFQLIMPYIDSDNTRQLYRIKEKMLGKILVKALNISPSSAEAAQLLEFKSARGHSAGNFAEIAYNIIEKRDSKLSYSDTTITQVLNLLSELSESKSSTEQVETMRKMLTAMNALEMKWILRTILRNMHINVSERTILTIWHPDAVALYNVTNDLKLVCHQLWDTSIRLESKDHEVKPLSCFKPQKALFKKNIMDHFDGLATKMPETFYMEEKVDGERMQLHYTDYGKVIRYFSRKGKDYTDYYGSSINDEKGSLSKYLRHAIDDRVSSCVLDGEVAAWDVKNKEVCALTKVKTAAIGGGSNSQFQPLLLVFDILHINGKDLTCYPLSERKRALERLIPEDRRHLANTHIEILPFIEGHSAEDIRREFDLAIQQMAEGLIVKNPLSRYTVDGRNNSWLKVKPEFMPGYQGENFDLIVVGANYGQGKRANILASFLCAIKNDNSYSFYTLVKVGNGFSMAMYEKIAFITEGKWKKFERNSIPPWLQTKFHHMPEMIIEPKDSVVIEVKAMQIVPSDTFSMGHTLRFPRFVSLREDKDFNSALCYSEFTEVQRENEPDGKRKKSNSSRSASKGKRRKLQYDEKSESINKLDGLFDGMQFYCAGDIHEPVYLYQTKFEDLLKSHGASIVRKATPESVYISDEKLPRVASIINNKSADVIHPRWIFDCIENGERLPFEPDHFCFAKNDTYRNARLLVDPYGFPLYRKQSVENVERLFDNMPRTPAQTDHTLLATLRLLMDSGDVDRKDTRGLLFAGFTMFFDKSISESEKKRLGRLIRFGSGVISGHPQDPSITHIINDDSSRYALYLRSKGPYIVPSRWITESWKEDTRLDEQKFI